MKRRSCRLSTLCVFLAWALLVPAAAQIPKEFKNLQVLPKDIEQRQLIGVMRGFATELGVRCNHCHVGENPQDLSTHDFASDEKESKRIARVMLKMVRQINGEHLPATGRPADQRLEVSCFTCHRGVTRPQTLEQSLLDPILEVGVEAGIQRYRLLRDKYYGQAVFDFGERSLLGLADTLSREHGNSEAAVAVLNLNLEYYPESAFTYVALAETLATAGDKEAAIENLEKAQALMPDADWLKRRLEALKQQ